MAGSTAKLRKLIERAEAWPEEAQDELLRAGLEIESGQAGAYEATPEELEAIDLADSAPIATEDEVAKAFAKFRRA
jgi:ATP-dependent protease HslVU (ClpYQ) peptidase subunit